MAKSIHVHASTLDAYRNLMEELKARHQVVRSVIGDATQHKFCLPPSILGELCYLQLRIICELIALSVLLVHGDIPGARTQRMKKEFRAKWIFDQLQNLHPDFYPTPGEQVFDDTGRVVEVTKITKGYLTKDELIRLYNTCSDKIHRGTLKTLMNERSFDFAQMASWIEKITILLNHHQIPLINPEHQIWVVMHGREDGKVHSYYFRQVAGPDGSPL